MITKRSRQIGQTGMTLIEVLVALAILGAMAGSVLLMTAQSARLAASVEDHLLARMVADNATVAMLASAGPAEDISDYEEIEFAGNRWAVERSIVNAGIAGLYRVTVTVTPAGGEQVLARVETLKAASQ